MGLDPASSSFFCMLFKSYLISNKKKGSGKYRYHSVLEATAMVVMTISKMSSTFIIFSSTSLTPASTYFHLKNVLLLLSGGRLW
ncbi:hypothetical protein ACLOJK_028709 [Asimina triloba]